MTTTTNGGPRVAEGPKKNGSTAHGPPARDAGLSEVGKLRMNQIRAVNTMVATIANESWGKNLHPQQLRAVAEYCRRFNLDISEVHVLGGNIYRNGHYYLRRFAELAREGRVTDFQGRHIGPDPRLGELIAQGNQWAKKEDLERQQLRIEHAVPPEAQYAYLAMVKVAGLESYIAGCKFIVLGKTKKKAKWANGQRTGQFEDVEADPIGNENPIETVQTRAWHKCGQLAAAEIPELRREEEEGRAYATATMADLAETIEREEQASADVRPAQPIPMVMLTEGPAPDFTVAQREKAAASTSDPYESRPDPAVAARAAAAPDLTRGPCEACGLDVGHTGACPYNPAQDDGE